MKIKQENPRNLFNHRNIGLFVVYGGNILLAILYLAPWIWAMAVTFLPQEFLYKYPPVLFRWPLNFDNYLEVIRFDDGRFLNSMKLSAIISVSTSIFVVVFGLLAGYAFAYLKFIGKKYIFILVLATMMFPFTAILIPLFRIILSVGLLNKPISLILLYTVFYLPFSVFLFRNSFEAIPKSIRDAARIDGCNEFNVLIRVILPLVKPAIASVIIYTIYNSWNEFTTALIFLTSEYYTTVPVTLSYLALSHRFQSKGHLLMTGSIIGALPMIILFLIFQKYFVKGIIAGSTKG